MDRSIKATEVDNNVFYLAVSNCELFDGGEQFDGTYLPRTGEKYRLMCAIDACSNIYKDLQREYHKLFNCYYQNI